MRSSQLFDTVFESRANRISGQTGCGNGEERQREDSKGVFCLSNMMDGVATSSDGKGYM